MAKRTIQYVLLDLRNRSCVTQLAVGFILGAVVTFLLNAAVTVWGEKDVETPKEKSRDTEGNIPALSLDDQEILKESKDSNSNGDDRLARVINRRVTVLCFMMVKPGDKSRAKVMKSLWTKRCDKMLFFGPNDDPSFPAINLKVNEGKEHLAAKTYASLKYIHDHHINDTDWFLKADDDTYIIMENLKYFLSDEDPSRPVYYGEYFNPARSKYLHYNSGGAGYVLSKEALRRFGTIGQERSVCMDPEGAEDRTLGYCLLKLGVEIGNTTDGFGWSRFHFDRVDAHAIGLVNPWYIDFMGDRYRKGIDSISDYPISFHYLNIHDMHVLDYVIYRLRPYGIRQPFPDANWNWRNASKHGHWIA